MWPSRAPHTATEHHKTGVPHKSHTVTPVLCQRPPPRDCCARARAGNAAHPPVRTSTQELTLVRAEVAGARRELIVRTGLSDRSEERRTDQ